MPTLNNARISTTGSGAIGFIAEEVGSRTLATTPSSSNAAQVTITVGAENIGNGVGLFARLTSRAPITALLDFKSLIAGPGITLTDIGDSVVFATTGAVPRFIDLGDGPGQIIGAGALLIGNTITNTLRWSSPPRDANSVLAWVANSLPGCRSTR
jgi:hypothetical protein